MSPAAGILAVLVAGGATTGGWTGSLGLLPTQEKSFAVLDTGGMSPEAAVAVDYPTVQVLLRGSAVAGGYQAAHTKAQEILGLLHRIPQEPTAYPALISCLARGSPLWLGMDESRRPRFSLNFNLIISPANPGHRV